MPAPQAQIGDEVESQCGVCHDSTLHAVLTVDEKGRAKRAECKVCGAKHLWRKPKGPEPRTGKTKAEKEAEAREKLRLEHEAAFEAALQASPAEDSVPYSIRGAFEEGQRLDHKKFGEGVVLKVVQPQLIEVIFRDSSRQLVMNR